MSPLPLSLFTLLLLSDEGEALVEALALALHKLL